MTYRLPPSKGGYRPRPPSGDTVESTERPKPPAGNGGGSKATHCCCSCRCGKR